MLYLENNLTLYVFTPARIAVLKLLASQAAISLENARLYSATCSNARQAYLAEAQRLSHTGSFGWSVATGEIFWSEETFQIFGFDQGYSAYTGHGRSTYPSGRSCEPCNRPSTVRPATGRIGISNIDC